jgi:SAM-dependent methyltransferase
VSDWTAGYRADIDYTYGYYMELNPARMKFALAGSGIEFPEVRTACELGYGQGISTHLHAAASNAQWYGTDFNPSQARFAQQLASTYSDSAKMYDESFAEFCSRQDLPDFDFIALHGIWSWISDDNREVLVEFLRRNLKVGGVVYISYNTMPGWAAFAPVRNLMSLHSKVIGAGGRGAISHVETAVDFVEKLFATNPMFARANPQTTERIKKLKSQNKQYLAHEFFNQHWCPMSISEITERLVESKVSLACPATYTEQLDVLHLTPEQLGFLAEIPDVILRQSVRDFMLNQQFRRDYWTKGPRTMSALEQVEVLRKMRFVLAVDRRNVPMKIAGTLGEIPLLEAIYNPLLDVLEKHEVLSVAELQSKLADKQVNLAQIIQALQVLAAPGHVAIAQDDAVISKAQKNTEKLNAALLNRARSSGDVGHLASPVTGGGINVSRFEQIFIQAIKQGKRTPAEWADFAWSVLAMQGQKLVTEGKTLDTAEDNIAELRKQAETFSDRRVAPLKALKII